MAIDAEPDNLKKLEGSFVDQTTPLGLDLILLTSPDKDGISTAYESNKTWWERWFSTLTPWRPNILPKRRRIWVRLFGVPLHIWSWEGFKKIIWRYGKLLYLDPETSEQSRFDVARAQIEVSYLEMVDEEI
ncbi:DUF4283 domain protein [Trifolium medium]|uniref:DUF4283 domain protein n=1 Tax=Trifolium medium TaxID=97028 RepID=A0A392Q266_9FABA|nr:DUF4283 domain protein [Trifolium medium]